MDAKLYGALVHVDHMNDGRSYRKWLRNTCEPLNVRLLIKHCSVDAVTTKRTTTRIVVALVGEESSVRNILKRWRTSRVDVDAKGKPCLERMMTVLLESPIEPSKSIDRNDWVSLSAESSLGTTFDQLLKVMEAIGGKAWAESFTEIFPTSKE